MNGKEANGRGLSVVVCTYNRSGLLRSCLESLAAQTAAADRFEVIVVDNNSTDDTLAVAGSFEDRPPRCRVVSEVEQGLSHARNRGCREARGEYVAFIDDDAKAPDRWIETALGIISAHRPDVIGGPIFPFYTSEKPAWFRDEYEIRVHQKATGWMEKEFVSGSNLFVRKDVWEELGGFDLRYGMSGVSVAYGEDTDFVSRARGAGKRIYYSLDLRVLHHVPAEKMDILRAMNAAFRSGLTTHGLWWERRVGYSEMETLYGALDDLFSNLDRAMTRDGFDRAKYPFRENFIFENCLKPLTTLGVLAGHARSHGIGGRPFRSFAKAWFRAKVRSILGK